MLFIKWVLLKYNSKFSKESEWCKWMCPTMLMLMNIKLFIMTSENIKYLKTMKSYDVYITKHSMCA